MLSKQEEKFIAIASHYATLSPMNNHHGCIVVLNGQEIGSGYNNYRNYSRDKIISGCLSCHAEISAVRNAFKVITNQRRIKKMKVYVVRLSDQGEYLDSKPCYNCHHRLHSLGIRNVIYSTGGDFINMDLRRHCSGNISTGYRYIKNLCA
jgi:deoxycytidylate deaminase